MANQYHFLPDKRDITYRNAPSSLLRLHTFRIMFFPELALKAESTILLDRSIADTISHSPDYLSMYDHDTVRRVILTLKDSNSLDNQPDISTKVVKLLYPSVELILHAIHLYFKNGEIRLKKIKDVIRKNTYDIRSRPNGDNYDRQLERHINKFRSVSHLWCANRILSRIHDSEFIFPITDEYFDEFRQLSELIRITAEKIFPIQSKTPLIYGNLFRYEEVNATPSMNLPELIEKYIYSEKTPQLVG